MAESEDMTPATSEESIAVPDPSGRQKGHSPYHVMCKRAIFALKARNGSSRKAVIRYIIAHNAVKKANCVRAVSRAMKRMLRGGMIYKNKRGLYKLTGKGRKIKKQRQKRRRKGARKSRRSRRKKVKKSKKGKKKRKKAKKGKKKGKKSKKSRKGRRSRRRKRRVAKRTVRRRKVVKRRRGKKWKKGMVKRRR